MFVKLTLMVSGNPIWVNVNNIMAATYERPHGEMTHSVVRLRYPIWKGDDPFIVVQEPPSEIGCLVRTQHALFGTK